MFHASTANEILFGGAAGGGKSKCIVMDAIMRCLTTPGFQAYLFRRTYPELESTLIPMTLAMVPGELGRYIGSTHILKFKNGSSMRFCHLQNITDIYNYQGAEIHGLYVDELTHFKQEEFDYLLTRLRASKAMGVVPIVRCASNPGNIGHGWVKARFVDAGPHGDLIRHLVRSETLGIEKEIVSQYIPSLAMENPYITQDYLLELERKPPSLRDALLYGKWDAFEGKVFMEFVDKPERYMDQRFTHVISPFEIPAHWRRYRSMDWGYSKPFSVGWWAISPDGTAYRYREWYGSSGQPDVGLLMTPSEVARGIIERESQERREGIKILGVADPAIWDVQTGESISDKFAKEGVFFDKADNSRLNGKMQVHYRMAFDEEGKPGMQIFSTCKDLIRTLISLPYSLTKPEDVDTKAEDHAYDEMRYFLMAWPTAPKASIPPKKRLFIDPLNQNMR